MRKIALILMSLSLLILPSLKGNAQGIDDEIIFTVGSEQIKVSEFLAVYNKNNYNNTPATEEDIREYLTLYTNFKLKVKEAYARGLDTNKAFINELATYRKQLAQPYLTDKNSSEQLLKEAYERMKEEVRASHIMIRVSENASPKDTLKAYKNILGIRNRVVKGEDFGELARSFSEDPSASENSGDLGYFSVLRMLYSFENVAYNSEIGSVSMPFRTKFGYHIMKVQDRRAAQGEIKCAHIMVSARDGETEEKFDAAKMKIDELYQKVLSGEQSFEELAKQYSEDPATAPNGGQLPFFSSGRMVESFETAAFALAEDGDVSKPIQTRYGFHIIKRLAKKGIADFDEVKSDLKMRIERDDRAYIKRDKLIAKLKEDYSAKVNTRNKNALITKVDKTFMEGKWASEKVGTMTAEVLNIKGESYSQLDFANYIQRNQSAGADGDQKVILSKLFDRFVDDKVIDYEDKNLEEKYPAFKSLMKEYKEGILLFELTDTEVWSKAVEDTAGLKAFHEETKGNYMWPQRLNAKIYTCESASIAKVASKMAKKKKFTDSDIQDKLNEASALNVRIQEGKFTKEDHPVLAKVDWETGVSDVFPMNNTFVFLKVTEVLTPQAKELNEVRGLVTSDYQNHLEAEWIKELKKKYPVQHHETVVKKVINRL